MNLLQIRTKVRRRIDELATVPEPFWSDAELDGYINQAYYYYWQWLIRAMHPICLKTALINLVSGTANYAVPTDYVGPVRLLEYVFDTYTVPLTYYERWDKPNSTVGLSTTGPRYNYHLLGSNLVIGPTPLESVVGGLKITYPYLPPLLAADTDTPIFSSQFHDLLYLGAVDSAKGKEEMIAAGGADVAPSSAERMQLEQLFKESIEPPSMQRRYTEPFCGGMPY